MTRRFALDPGSEALQTPKLQILYVLEGAGITTSPALMPC